MMNREFHTVRGYQLLEQNKKHLTPAMEDYLEMIYRYSMKEGYLRIGELAELLNVSAPSTSKMVQRLSALGLINFRKYGIIMLSEDGKQIGEYLLDRHRLLENFLTLLGCKEDILELTELMEHAVNPELLRKIKIFTDFLIEDKVLLDRYRAFAYKHYNDTI